jgi:hypothetical protein
MFEVAGFITSLVPLFDETDRGSGYNGIEPIGLDFEEMTGPEAWGKSWGPGSPARWSPIALSKLPKQKTRRSNQQKIHRPI